MNKQATKKNPVASLGREIRLIEQEVNNQSTKKTEQERPGKQAAFAELITDKLFLKEIELLQSLPAFKEYELSAKDIVIIAHLWSDHLTSPGRGLSWDDLCMRTGMDIYETNACLSYIADLYKRKIINIDNKQWHPSTVSPFDIIGSEISLNINLLIKIFDYNIKNDIEHNLAKKWENNDIFLRDLFYCMKTVMFYAGSDNAITYWRDQPKFEVDNLIFSIQPLIQRMKEAADTLNIAQMVRKLKLDDTEIMILLIVIYSDSMALEQIEAGIFLQMFSRNDKEYNHNAQYLEPESRLISGKLIRIYPDIRGRFIRQITPTPRLLWALKGNIKKR